MEERCPLDSLLELFENRYFKNLILTSQLILVLKTILKAQNLLTLSQLGQLVMLLHRCRTGVAIDQCIEYATMGNCFYYNIIM